MQNKGASSLFKSSRNEPFMSRFHSLKGRFDRAYDFFEPILYNRKLPFYMGTSVNAHLYYATSFLSRIIIEEDEVLFFAATNKKLKVKGPGAARFAQVLEQLIEQFDGTAGGWSRRTIDPKIGDGVALKNGVPPELFERLLEQVQAWCDEGQSLTE